MKYVTGQDEIVMNAMRKSNKMLKNISIAVEKTCVDVANHAKNHHDRGVAHSQGRYENRTGVLTKSIASKLLEVSLKRVVGTVFGGTDYAYYVEFGIKKNHMTGRPNKPYPFFQPALLASQDAYRTRMSKIMKGI